jgi:flagellar motor switch protein FliM
MTLAAAPHLSSARVRRLLAAVGSTHEPEQASAPAAEYDWRDPHYFNEDQLNRLAALMSRVAAHMAQTFAHFHHGAFDVAPVSVTQHFAGDLHNLTGTENDYCLTFGPAKNQPCGFAVIPAETARAWVGPLLGDAQTDGPAQRTLSCLEESLLCDLVTALVESFLSPLRAHHNLKADGPLGKGQPNIQYELTEELCHIALRVKKAGSEEATEMALLLPCSRLAALVGKAPAPAVRIPPQELSRAMMEHLQQMSVTVTARLASTSIRFREMLDLGRGDILLLGQPLDEPLELVVEGRTVLRGRPARSEGRYAVLVTPASTGRTQEAPAPKTSHEVKKG